MIRLFLFTLSVLLSQASVSAAIGPAVPRERVCTVAELNRRLEEPQSQDFHFTLTGVVTAVSKPEKSNRYGSIVLRDQTDRGQIFSSVLRQYPEIGSRVIAIGHAHVTKSMERWMECVTATTIGRVTPDEPIPVPLSRLEDRETDLWTVKVSATVIDAFRDDLDPDNYFILLKDNATVVPAIGPPDSGYKDLVDAKVEVTGIVRRSILGGRKYLGSCLCTAGLE